MIQLENIHKATASLKVLKGIDLQIQDQGYWLSSGPFWIGKVGPLLNVLPARKGRWGAYPHSRVSKSYSQLADAQLTAFRREKTFIFQQWHLCLIWQSNRM